MRILFLTSRLPYPPNRGDRLRALNIARVLSREHDLHLLSFIESEAERSAVPALHQYFARVDTVMLSHKRQTVNMALAALRGESLWVRRFWSAEMQRRVDQRLRDGAYDIVYCYTTRMGKYVENATGPYRILDFVDAVFLLVSRMASHSRSWLKRALLIREARLIEQAQMQMGPRFDECWMVSDADREAIANWREAHIRVVRNGIDSHYFVPDSGPAPDAPTLLFVGYMGQESVVAVHEFCDKALGAIVEKFPRVVVNIVGADPPSSIVALGADPHVNVLGFVPNLRAAYAGAHVLIAPMPFVAGVQNKVLEALAMGIPAVVTRYANEGVGASANEGVLVVEDMGAFAAAVVTVLSRYDEWHRRALENGRNFITKRFRWEIAAERVRQIASDKDLRATCRVSEAGLV